MDSSLKTLNNSIYAQKRKKKRYRGSKVKHTVYNDIQPKIYHVLKSLNNSSKWGDFYYTNTFMKNRGLYIVSESAKIIVVLLDKQLKIQEGFDWFCRKKGYKVLPHSLKENNTHTLLNNLGLPTPEFNNWLKGRAKELNDNIPLSEVWFKKLFIEEPFYSVLGIEYNKPFKRFIYDVYSSKYRLVIEVDGSIHDTDEQRIKDNEKNRLTKSYGLKIIRVRAYTMSSYNEAISEIVKILATPKKENTYSDKGPIILRKSIS